MKKLIFALLALTLLSSKAFSESPLLEKEQNFMIYITEVCEFYDHKVIITTHGGHGKSMTKKVATEYSAKDLKKLIKMARKEKLVTKNITVFPNQNLTKAYYSVLGIRKKLTLLSYDENLTHPIETLLNRKGPSSQKLLEISNQYCPELE